MADFSGSYQSGYTSPTFIYDISYSETGRASGSATYSVTVVARMTSTSSAFGYTLDGTVTIGNASQTIRFKNNETWSGTTGHSFTFTLTPTGVGDGGGTISARFQGTRPNNDGNSGKIDTGGDETVSCSVWNTAPSMSGVIGTTPNGTIAENISQISLTSWTGATDKEGGLIYYEILRELNQSGSWTTLTTINDGSDYTDTIGAGNQGQIIRYAIRARDSGGLTSNYIFSPYITKNTFTPATLSSTDSIVYGDTSLLFTISGANNTNGVTTGFSYSLSCSQVTVYNPTSTPTTVAIKTTATGTDTYILLSDIKNATRSTGFKGTFNFTLTTTNTYGSTGSSTKSIAVDLTTQPSTFSAVTTSGTYSIGGANFYIPDRKGIVIDWGDATDLVDGGAITYDVQVSYDGGSTYSTIKTGLTTSTYTTTLPQVSSVKQCKFNIIAYTTYGTSRSLALATAIDLHYYNPPTIVFDDVVRTQTQATVSLYINYNTSISPIYMAVSTVSPSTYFTTSGGLVTSLTATTYNSGTKKYSTTLNIADTVSCTFNFTAQDNGGIACGTTATIQSKAIPVYVPIMSIRSTGVSINTVADANYKLKVGGNTFVNGTLSAGITEVASLQVDGDINVDGSILENGVFLGNRYLTEKTAYSYANGHLIDICTASTNLSQMFTIEVTGNGYAVAPIDTTIQFYHYTPVGSFLNYKQLNNGVALPTAKIFLDSGRIKVWFAQATAYTTVKIKVFKFGVPITDSVTLTNVAEPTGTNKVTCSVYNSVLKDPNGMLTGGTSFGIQGVGTGATNTCWLGFYDSASTRTGWVGDGNGTDSDFGIGSDVGSIVLAPSNSNTKLGSGGARIDHTGNTIRIYTSPLGSNDYGWQIQSDGSLSQVVNSTWKAYITGSGDIYSTTNHACSGSYTSAGSPGLEMESTDGGTPFIDWKKYNDVDYEVRMINSNYSYMDVNFRNAGTFRINGTMSASTKSAITQTETYGEIILYCDESPNHIFCDRGRGTTDEDGYCYVMLDPIYIETVNTKNSDYYVQLTGFSNSNVEIDNLQPTYFVVKGQPNKEFCWEVNAERKGYERLRWNNAQI